MTSDRIRWCMKCNLMVTSRKCPRCRSDVYNLHLEKGAKLAPLFNNHIRIIRSKIDDNYGPGCGELLIPDDRTSMFEISNGRRNIIIDGGVGDNQESTIVDCTENEILITRQGKGILD